MIVPATPTQTGEITASGREDSTAALTSTISPGSGTPRLSIPTTSPTVRYTASGGIVRSRASTVTLSQTTRLQPRWIVRLRPRNSAITWSSVGRRTVTS